jgi:hypothetical protein
MPYVIPIVIISDKNLRVEAIREANELGAAIGSIYTGEPVEIEFDFEDLDACEPNVIAVVEVRE